MIAYVGVAPIAAAFADRVPRRSMLVALDLVRGGVAVFLPFVTEIWQVYLLIFLLQSASAGSLRPFRRLSRTCCPTSANIPGRYPFRAWLTISKAW